MEAASAGTPRELSRELRGDLSADLVAARADRRAEEGAQAGRLLGKALGRGGPGGGGVLRRASPTGMDDGDRLLTGENERNAVGGLHDERDSGKLRREDVALPGVADGSPRRRLGDFDRV